MNKIRLVKFKAFESELVIPLNNSKNLLLYGENGAGKTSIYEALKVAFFYEKIEGKITAQTPEDLLQLKSDLWSSYNNKINNQPFEIELNDVDYKVFTTSDYQVFLISIEELSVSDNLNLITLLERFYFPIDIHSFCQTSHQIIEDAVNLVLESFSENVRIEVDEEDDYSIKITDTTKNIERKLGLKMYFNEAKLNLIILLILLNAITNSKDAAKNKILVLDDFITSLDSSNRTFLLKYLFENFPDTQILIFTHNISFYNLIRFVIFESGSSANRWEFASVFEINNIHKVYVKSGIEKAAEIKSSFEALVLPATQANIEEIGNRIRKKFEILLYEYSKLAMIGTVEDSGKILNRIMNSQAAYYKNRHTASDLIDEIVNVLGQNNGHNLSVILQSKIEEYKNIDFDNFKKIIKELKLYQKVTMHPLSHGVSGMPTFTIKEIEKSLILLEKMEGYLKDLVDTNVVAV